MKEIKIKSCVPIYALAAVWVLYCVFLPLYKTWHFIVLACAGALTYIVFSKIFPGKTKYIEIPKEPVRTGNEEIDALLLEGERAVSEMRRIGSAITDEGVRKKLAEIIEVTDKIFKNLLDDPGDYRQVKRFSDFYLPTTIKLLNSYDRMSRSGVEGDNILGTINRIEAVLDSILGSYKKFFDSLFENQALDIETDITVLENMLKKEGLLGKDF